MTENQKLRAALKAKLDLTDEIRKSGRPPHPDYWVQSLCEVEAQMREALALPTAALGCERHQALMDPENQPNQFGLTFSMRGTKMAFCIGNQCFQLDYEPDDESDFSFMQDMLCKAFSTFTPDVKTAAPVGERLTLSAEDVHTAFVKHFPKTLISQAWIGFAAEIAEAMQARAALSARKPLTSEQVKALKGEYGYSLAPVQAQADFINGIRCGEKAHGIDAAMRKDKL